MGYFIFFLVYLYFNKVLIDYVTFFYVSGWVAFDVEVVFIQFFIIYLLYQVFFSKNIYYLLLYLFIFIFLMGFILCFFQADFYTGFLWVTEFTLIFVILLLLFFLNITPNINYCYFNTYLYAMLIIVVFSFMIFSHSFSNSIPFSTNLFIYWDDYYESLNNINLNDFSSLFLGYYVFNSTIIIILGLILLITTLICVILNTSIKNFKSKLPSSTFHLKNFLFLYSFQFLRKQHLHTQSLIIPTVKVFKKK